VILMSLYADCNRAKFHGIIAPLTRVVHDRGDAHGGQTTEAW
jgi:hypothetical protein